MVSSNGAMPGRTGHWLAGALIAVSGLYIFRWVFAPEVTFYEDDWSWLRDAVFLRWGDFLSIWTVLPRQLFHDRPIENIIVKLLYHAFELDHDGYAAACLALHIANALLFYRIADRLLDSRFYAMLAAVLFVIDYNVAYPAWWMATVADSAALFFCFCSFLAFSSPRRAWSAAGSVAFYWLAFKSKETALPFPLLLLAYAFVVRITAARWTTVVGAFRSAISAAWPVLCAFFIFLAFALYYFIEAKKGGMQSYGPYAPRFDAATVLDSAGVYLRFIAFDLVGPRQALIGFVVLAAISLVTLNRAAILGVIGFFVAIGQGFFLPTQHEAYYAYGASAYVALMLTALVQRAQMRLAGNAAPASVAARALLLLAVAVFAHYVYSLGLIRSYVVSNSRDTARALQMLMSAVSQVEEKSLIVVTGVPGGGSATLFTHAPCFAINVIYKVSAIDCRIEGGSAELSAVYEQAPAPKMLLRYDKGDVALIARTP